MIKQINHQNFLMSPFVAMKSWNLQNIENNDLIYTEISASTSFPVALEYMDYLGTGSVLNRDCNIALEQQSTDLAIFEEGISGSGRFDATTDETNLNGTYKRLVYVQTMRAFYNSYRNPTQIFGMENIDFPLSKTKRFLANSFRTFTVPQSIFGDKILEGSIQLFDNTLDDNVNIVDDTNGNIVAGTNLFAHVQEVRELGSIPNVVIDAENPYTCP